MKASNIPSSAVRIIGVGGAGCNAVNYMLGKGLVGADFVVMNTDAQALRHSECPYKVYLGAKYLQGGIPEDNSPEHGRICAEDSRDEITGILRGARVVFIIAGLGGATGTGASPVIAGIAGELGVLVVCFVTMPFAFEGKKRVEAAQKGVETLQSTADRVFAYPNDDLSKNADRNQPVSALFEKANDGLYQVIKYFMDEMSESEGTRRGFNTTAKWEQKQEPGLSIVSVIKTVADHLQVGDQSAHEGGPHLPDIISGNVKTGDVIFGVYRVESGPFIGGSSTVYRVSSLESGEEHALRCFRPDVFISDKHKKEFISLGKILMKLGEHPHVLHNDSFLADQKTPVLISEWMDGGTLKDWIHSGKLYEGGANSSLLRILDIAGQLAEGLRFLHEQENLYIIYEGVNPDCLLLTRDGKGKLIVPNGSFVVVKARLELEDDIRVRLIGHGCGAYIPSYCSPEQAVDETVLKSTDIYSWALTTLEMFLGERLWSAGQIVTWAYEDCLAMDMRVPMPEAMKDLLRSCLKPNPDKRPQNFAEVAEALSRISKSVMECANLRPDSGAAADVTICDGGKTTIQSEEITTLAPAATCFGSDETILSTEAVKSADTMDIEKGVFLLDAYRVESDAMQGGMGKVWRVRHTGWNVDLAIKQPKAALFQSEFQRTLFINECEAWINLGLHPQIVSCYYVREIGGVPSIFSEWMAGGSLKDWIKSGKLYEGDTGAVFERVLDIAIQFGRGLHYAHEQGLIHQDVKPDNLLLTSEGEAKVADFGIAKARAVLTVQDSDLPTDATTVSASGVYTPAYCSMEQINGEVLTRRTDIYSWAVSVLEMFLGERFWDSGIAAGIAIEDYLSLEMRVPMPESVKDLLRRCLEESTEKRPHDFAEIDAMLLQIYQDATALTYLRELSKATANTADSLNNRALSFLDMGKTTEAEKCWEQALELNSTNPAARFNRAVYKWRRAEIDDLAALAEVKNAYQNNLGNAEATLLYAHICVQRCDYQQADKLLRSLENDEAEALNTFIRDRKTVERFKNTTPFTRIIDINEKKGLLYTLPVESYSGQGIKLVSLKSFRTVKNVDLNTRNCRSVCISRDGRYAAISKYYSPMDGALDGAIGEIVRLPAGERVCYLTGVKAYIVGMGFSCDGRNLFTVINSYGGETALLKAWDTESGGCIMTFALNLERIDACCFAPHADILLAASGGELLCYDTYTGKRLHSIYHTENAKIKQITFSSGGKYTAVLLKGEKQDRVFVFDTMTWRELHSFKVYNNIEAVAISPDGAYLCGLEYRDYVRVWDINSGKCVFTYVSQWGAAFPSTVCFQVSENRFLVGCDDNGQILSLPSPPSPRPPDNWYLSRVTSMGEYIRQRRQFAAVEARARELLGKKDIDSVLETLSRAAESPVFFNSPVRLELNEKAGEYCKIKGVRAIIPGGVTEVEKGHFSHNRRFLCRAIKEGKKGGSMIETNYVEIFEAGSDTPLHRLKLNRDLVYRMDVSNNGKYFVAYHFDRQLDEHVLKLWSLEGEPAYRYLYFKQETSVKEIYFSPDAKSLYVCSENFISKRALDSKPHVIWNTRKTISSTSSFTLNFNGSRALVGTARKRRGGNTDWGPPYRVALLDTQTGEVIRTFGDMPDLVSNCSFCPDENYALVDCLNRTIGYWEINTGEKLASLDDIEIYKLHFPPGQTYACDSAGHILRFDYEYEFPGFTDWDEGALPYLKHFLEEHPDYTIEAFKELTAELRIRGFGYIRTNGVRTKLDELQFGW